MKIFKKRSLLILGLMVFMVVGGLTAAPKKKIVLSTNRSDLVPTVWKEIADKYEAASGVAIEFETASDQTAIKTRLSGGTLPDIFLFDMNTFIQDDWPSILVPLDDLKFIKDLQDQCAFTYKGKTV